jgi:hypothetical protein
MAIGFLEVGELGEELDSSLLKTIRCAARSRHRRHHDRGRSG